MTKQTHEESDVFFHQQKKIMNVPMNCKYFKKWHLELPNIERLMVVNWFNVCSKLVTRDHYVTEMNMRVGTDIFLHKM